MQIHELNGYSGALDDAYMAVDNGSDTGKKKVGDITDPLNARIDNIIAGGDAPSEAEIIDARLGATSLGSKSYPSLGDAIRGQVGILYDDITDMYDNMIVPVMNNGKYVNYSNGNLISDGSSAYTDAISVTPGMKLRLRNLYIIGDRSVCWYKANGFGGCFANATTATEIVITIPADAVSIRATAKVNETVEVHVIDEIESRFEGVDNSLETLSSEIEKRGTRNISFEWSKFKKPSGFPFSIPFNIYTDGLNFKTDFSIDDYLNTGGTTYYTAPGATSSNDGLTRETPRKFSNLYSNAVNGDTIILLEGDYDRDTFEWGNTIVQKNINIIGEGRCRIFAGQLGMTFTQTSGYTNVYQTTRSAAVRVIDYKTIDGEYIGYALKTSIADVDSTEGSYYINGSTVYVHALGHGNPSALVCVTVQSEKFLECDNQNQNTHIVFKNIDLIGKATGVQVNRISTSNTLEVYFDDVNCYYCGNTNNDSFKVYGGTAIFNNCKAMFSYKDGFNHNGQNLSGTTTDTLCIEIDCIGSSCGLLQSGESQNGTTTHAGGKTVRINGIYFDNFGANVADVQTDTMSINLGCKAFYSAGTAGGANENFAAQQAGTTMWLYGCVGVGAVKDLSCVSGSTMHLDKCTYKVKAGAGTYDEQNTLPFDIYTLYKISEVK